MPTLHTRLPDGSRRFDLRPNGALTPHQARRFLWITGGAMLAIAAWFVSRGLWPILPFAGLELAVLAWALRASMRDSRRTETIVVEQDTVRIERQDRAGTRRAEFPRHWARVRMHAGWSGHHPSRLLIESHGRGQEIGRFLTEEERRELARGLARVIGGISASPSLE